MRGTDTNRLDPAPQAAGRLAVSLGLAHNLRDDHEMLAHGMVLYDALHAWWQVLPGGDPLAAGHVIPREAAGEPSAERGSTA